MNQKFYVQISILNTSCEIDDWLLNKFVCWILLCRVCTWANNN